MKKTVLTTIFLAIAITGFSQDYIIKKNGGRIDCKVTKEDTANVYITMSFGGNDVDTYINKKEIQSISYGNTQSKKTEINNTITPNFQKNRISFNIGACIATGDYGNTDINHDGAGLAKTGACLNFYYSHLFIPNFGLGVKWYGIANPLETDGLIKELKTQSGYDFTTNNAYWSSGGLLGGLVFDFKDANDTHYEFNILTGPMTMESPEVKYTLSGSSAWIKQSSATATTWGFDFGIGISHPISRHWSLSANADYMIGSFNFDEYQITDSMGSSQTYTDSNMKFHVINLTLGLGYNFNVN